MKLTKFVLPTLAAALVSGCVVAPLGVGPAYPQAYPQGDYAAPPGVVYVPPTYALPAVGFAWAYHPRFGWGWRHPQRGWHRGWR